jgi:hypothetical protein
MEYAGSLNLKILLSLPGDKKPLTANLINLWPINRLPAALSILVFGTSGLIINPSMRISVVLLDATIGAHDIAIGAAFSIVFVRF